MSGTRFTVSFFFAAMFLAALLVPARAHAVIASPDVHVLEQPDGTKFNAIQWGDENRHGWETEDGYAIVFDEPTNRWTYASRDFNGNLAGTNFVAGKDAPPVELKKHLRPLGKPFLNMKTSKERAFESLMLSPSGVLSPQGAPAPLGMVAPAGTANVAAVLINFSDRTTAFTPAQINDMLFGTGNYSVADFYTEVSYNKFSVAPGPSSLSQWYEASHGHDYYGKNDFYNALLIMEAAQLADASGFDFNAYDADGDCRVDVLAVIHQGPGQDATGNVKDIWSHRFSLAEAATYCATYGCGGLTLGPVTTSSVCSANPAQHVVVDDYIITPEKYGAGISTIGVFAHEYGHSFGLPDLYDTDYTSAGIGRWSLMAAGSWNKASRAGDRPSHMDAWCKYALGWVAPAKVTAPLTNQPISAASTTADVYQLLIGTPPVLSNSVQGSGEYFLVENRQKSGFDAGLPGSGLLIWHVDESQPTNDCAVFPFFNGLYWDWFTEYRYLHTPNCSSSSHYHVALVEADNRYQMEGGNCYISGDYIYCTGNYGDAGDPFPGSTNKRVFSRHSHNYNNSNIYNGYGSSNGYPSNVIVTDIGDSGPVMTASMTSQPVALTSTPSALANAVDNPVLNAAPLSFSGAWGEQNLVTFTGGSAAQSGAITSGASELVTTIDGPASVSFYWKVSSQRVHDYLKVTMDGKEQARISGQTVWKQKWLSLSSAATHTIKWIYAKNGSVSKGLDAGWVDNVQVNEFPKVAVISPNGGEKWAAGSSQNITWNAPAAGTKYKLYYTVNNGTTWTLIDGNVTGTGYPWPVPPMNGNKTACRVKVVAYTASGALVGSDASDAFFTIEVLKVNYPNVAADGPLKSMASSTINYTIGSTVTPVAGAMFYYTLDGGTTWKWTGTDTVNVTPGTHDFPWTVPVTAPALSRTRCKVKAILRSSTGAVLGTDTSDEFFTVNLF